MNKHSSNYLVDNRVCMKTTHIGEGDYGVLIGKKCYSNSCKRERKRQTKLMNLCMKKQNTINDPESDDYIKLDEEISNNYAEEIEKCTNDNCEKRAAADFGPLMMTGGDKRKTHRRRRGKSRSYKKRMQICSPYMEHIKKARRLYGVDTIAPSQELSVATGCSVDALQKIVSKGEGGFGSTWR